MSGRPRNAAPLTMERIVRAAIELSAAEGLGGIRMRDLAGRLGVSVGALYRHVPNQARLQDAVVDHVLGEVPDSESFDGDPRTRIIRHVQALQTTLDRHRGLTAAVVASATAAPNGRRLRRAMHLSLMDAGLDEAAARAAYQALEWYWLGARTAVVPGPRGRRLFQAGLEAMVTGLTG